MSETDTESNSRWSINDYIYRGPFWRHRPILLLNFCLILPLFSSVICGLDTSMVNGLQILPEWQSYFGHPHGVALGLINSVQNLGALACLPLAPYASDILGRRPTLFMGSVIMLGGVALQGLANTVRVLIGAKILIGFGLTFSMNASPLLITELAYPTHRARFSSIYNTFWYAGSVLSAWVCFGAYEQAGRTIWSWRVPVLAQAIFPLLQATLVWFIPESPRYLVSKGLESQAARVLAKYHSKNNNENDPLIVYEMAQIRHAIKMEKDAARNVSYLHLVSTPGNRKRMRIIFGLAIFSQWSGNGLVSYYINLVLDGVGITSVTSKAGINGGLQIFNFACAITGALLVDRVGRRTLFLISNCGMLIVFSMWTLTNGLFSARGNTDAAKATVPLIFLFFLFYDIAYTPILVSYTLEILTYDIRAKGLAFMNLMVSLTQFFNQFVNPIALERLGWKYYLVYCALLACYLVYVYFFLVETKGRTLEETAVLFDGLQQAQMLTQIAGDVARRRRGPLHILRGSTGTGSDRISTDKGSSMDRSNSARSTYSYPPEKIFSIFPSRKSPSPSF